MTRQSRYRDSAIGESPAQVDALADLIAQAILSRPRLAEALLTFPTARFQKVLRMAGGMAQQRVRKVLREDE